MSNLHVYFHLKNEQAFAKALEAARTNTQVPSLSSSAGKRNATHVSSIDVNARDWLGRTVLHLACAVHEPYALAYVRLLLSHPGINVNAQDTESKWTPLHRALYNGNVAACLLLLRRPEIDVQLRDNEGLTPFDLYNLTVEGTWPLEINTPPGYHPLSTGGDLFTWGGNRNAALGHGDSNDRLYPDQVVLEQSTKSSGPDKFIPIQVTATSMAKLHTTIITNEKGPNLRACGFGSGGRLGSSQHTQYALLHISQIPSGIVAVAPAQDHTLALTSRGEVWTWGLGRFSQLGYLVEPPSGNVHIRSEEPIQICPRKVIGPLKKEVVIGVAACKTASACWTTSDVFTWGTNNGQLGYDSAAHAVQILPRKVTGVQNVIQIALTDTAMACLLENGEITCFRDDSRFRVKFPSPDPADSAHYIPPNPNKPPIRKVTSCEGTIAALTKHGEVWTFSVPGRAAHTGTEGDRGREKDRPVVKPQRVWAARKSVDPARDVALGTDGDLIVCTDSGHVFVRSRTAINVTISKSSITNLIPSTTSATSKGRFHRMPLLHRVVRVCANATGAFGALRSNYIPTSIKIEGSTLGEDFNDIRPWVVEKEEQETPCSARSQGGDDDRNGDEVEALSTRTYSARGFIALLATDKALKKDTGKGVFSTTPSELLYGADLIVQAGIDIPAHRLILATRSTTLRQIMDTGNGILREGNVVVSFHSGKTKTKIPRLTITGVQPLAVLLFLHFFYTDTFPTLDSLPFASATQIRRDVALLASITGLDEHLDLAVGASGIRVPMPTLSKDTWELFNNALSEKSLSLLPDVFLELADRRVPCHSVILRARCLFFRNFFDEAVWTISRRGIDGNISVDLKHMEWRAVSFVMEWVYKGEEDSLFTRLDNIDHVQELIDLIFEVMAVASELVLDRLMLVCSISLLRYITLHNVTSILARATYYNALPLVASLHDYVACNLEAIMESRLLEREHEPDSEMLIPALGAFIRARQADSAPITRTGVILEEAMKKYQAWLDLQDIPSPLLRTPLRPRGARQRSSTTSLPSLLSPSPNSSSNIGAVMDDIFPMDGPSGDIPVKQHALSMPMGIHTMPKSAWKAAASQEFIPKVDMKTIMAEAACTSGSGSFVSKISRPAHGLHKQESTPPRPAAGSSWRLPTEQPAVSTSAAAIPAPIQQPPSTPPRVSNSPSASNLMTSPARSKDQPVAGPVFTPVFTPRRTHSDGPAWNTAPMTTPGPLLTTGLSFAAIQQQQREQGRAPAKEKRSLVEIQEEERAKQEEESFMRWWAAEEQRLKEETQAALNSSMPSTRGHGSQRGQGSKSERTGGPNIERRSRRGRPKNNNAGNTRTSPLAM